MTGSGTTGRIIAVTGTATGIGKTHLAEAMLLGLRAAGRRAAGAKPVESGVTPDALTDVRRLDAASAVRVPAFGHAFPDPVSPHLAARRVGVQIRLPPLVAALRTLARDTDDLVIELPGGLFSPISDTEINADFLRALAPAAAILAAPDRLGVLHDVIAATRAATSLDVTLTHVVLIAPPTRDDSTGTNAAELRRFVSIPVLEPVRRDPPDRLASSAEVQALLASLPA